MIKFIILFIFSISVWAQNINDPKEKSKQKNRDKEIINVSAKDIEVKILSYLAPYFYDGSQRRDPFEIPLIYKKIKLVKQGAKEDLSTKSSSKPQVESLSIFHLEDLNLIGIIWNAKSPKALFSDARGKVWPAITINERIGNKNGYIAAIREDEVVVIETILSGGKTKLEARSIKLKR